MRRGSQRQYPYKESLLFDGGLNTKFEVSLIGENESPDCFNVIFSNGAVATREGSTKLNTNAVSAQTFNGLYTRRDNDGSSETMVAWAGTDMFYLGSTTFITVPSGQSAFTISKRVTAVNFQDYLFIGQQTIIPYKYDGTALTRHGVYPPTSAIIGASAFFGATSAPTGANLASGSSYTYKIVFVNTQLVESDVGEAKTFVVTANSMGDIRLTSIPVAPQSFGINARRIYRTVAGGSAFKRLATISDNTTTTYDDGITDANLGAAAPTDNGVPPKYTACIYHKNRLFCNDPDNPNYVWYSNLNTPYTFASTNFRRVGDAASDLVKGFGVFENGVIVFCENSSWIIYMPSTDDTTWLDIRTNSAYGSRSHHGIVAFNNKLFFPAMQNTKFSGFGVLTGASQEMTTTSLSIMDIGSELVSDRIEPDMFDVPDAQSPNISSIVYKNKIYTALPIGSGQTTNNRILIYDFSVQNVRRKQQPNWSIWKGLNAEQMTIYGGNLYYCGSTDGFVYRLEAGVYADNSAAIDSYYWTKEFSGYEDDYNLIKDWRYMNILVDNAGSYQMGVKYRVDSDVTGGNSQNIDLTPGGSLWGSATWGVSTWGGGTNQKEYRVFFGSLRGRRIQIQFNNQNTANQRFKVHRMNLFYNIVGSR